jgi:type II secretory pathway pseudopilin PulG
MILLPLPIHIPSLRPRRGVSLLISSRHARRGVSLLEVLVSMFIMLVGLAGVAALLPVGQHSLAEAAKADRAGACGRAGLREVKIRGILDPTKWVVHDSSSPLSAGNWTVRPAAMPPTAPTSTSYVVPTGFNQGSTYVIDPLFIAYNAYSTSSVCARFGYCTNGSVPQIKRATLLRRPMSLLEPLTAPPTKRVPTDVDEINRAKVLLFPEARRLFTFDDDLSFDVSTAPNIRTRANMLRVRTSGNTSQLGVVAYPIISTTDNNTEITGQVPIYQQFSSGEYSWMVTVSPALQEQSTVWSTSQLYTVSVVVFHRRVLAMPTATDLKPCERVVLLTQSDLYQTRFGFGGGQLVLRTANIYGISSSHTALIQNDDYLETKPGDWLMVAARRVVPSSTQNPNADRDKGSVVCQWYRVINSVLGPAPSNSSSTTYSTQVRYVSVVGPDWRDLKDYSGAGENKPQRFTYPTAILMTGVVGVYQMTVNLDSSTAWSRATNN